jgi:hypothetical protein
MKTKLLRKIRKRYSITHYPNGLYVNNRFYGGPQTILEDKKDDFRDVYSQAPKKQAYDELRNRLMSWIDRDYGPLNSKLRKIKEEKLWHNPNQA